MKLHQLSTNRKTKKRLARGNAGKGGHTAGRGTKGQKSRSGYNLPKRFEGGQTSLVQRLPKVRGFRKTNNQYQIVQLSILEKEFSETEKINPSSLYKKNIIDNKKIPVKILADIKLKKKLIINGCSMSAKAKKIIEQT